MEELIETINQLQDVFMASGHGMDLPQVVVVGAQSAGKSSVLEHLVGKSFLPRGPGVVTRCPLVLQLLHAPNAVVEEYAIFQHDQTKVFTDFNLICREIQEHTVRLAGKNKGICETPIGLKIYSSSFLNLTLVDLPGLTKVPVGDQPDDIERQTRELTFQYIKNPNCIILAITPANADMATSESLSVAREVDPEGSRTLAVITKLDLMDEGTDAWDVLTGRVIPVKLGIIGVVNRSQKDIMENKSMKRSLKDEAEFFHKNYRKIEALHGTPYLTKTVQGILIDHIKNCLPKLKETVNHKLTKKRAELEALGDSKMDKPTLLIHLMTKFSRAYCSGIRGDSVNIQTNELSGGARINYVFQESLSQALSSIDALAGLSKSAILTATQNASGASPALFVPEVAFELLVKRQIQRLRAPSLQCVGLIHQELCRIVQSCTEDSDIGLLRYPRLQRQICCVVNDLLQSRIPITNQMIEHFLDVQLAYINTAHPDFLPNCGRKTPMANIAGGELCIARQPTLRLSEENLVTGSRESERPNRDCLLIQELIQSYFSIVRKSVQDTVPKIIMNFLVNFMVDHLQSELISRLYNGDVSDLLQESQVFADTRHDLQSAISQLEEAASILSAMKSDVKRAPLFECCIGHK